MADETGPGSRSVRKTARLRSALADREARLREAEDRIAALESSASLRVGRLLTSVLRRPARGLPRLPRDLYHLWRDRGRPVSAAGDEGGRPLALAGLANPAPEENRLLLGLPGAVGDIPVIAAVLGPAEAPELERHARIIPLLPHNGAALTEIVDADLVVVDARAGEPGGPWAYLGEPGIPDREAALLAIFEAATARAIPVILWRSAAIPPALAAFPWSAITEDPLNGRPR